ncbi:MAG: hypothetical protein MI923_23030 [Phycisphaerales bacterium]|nr:hypothetical protein [Phycisphaerales bacterium]
MRIALRTLIAASALAIAWQVGAIRQTPHQTAPAGIQTPVKDGNFRGMAIQLHGGLRIYEHYCKLIPEVVDLGADTVMLVAHGWQTHAGSLDLHIDAQKTANAEDLGKLLDLATSHGLRKILMPVVLLSKPRDSEWRGKIVPPGHDWDAWFKRYRQFVVHFAKIAERHKVDVLMIGSELIKSEAYTQRWRETIREVRQHYRGKLGYSANWDHYQTNKIGFWPELDYVGMTSYYELAKKPNPSIQEIDKNWRRFKKKIKAFHREVRKPIIFTEVGWCSQEGAAHEGWNYYRKQEATAGGHREQALLYESFLKTWGDEPLVGGIIWWEWGASEGGTDDYGYTPRGKPAEALLRQWFKSEPNSKSGNKMRLLPAER